MLIKSNSGGGNLEAAGAGDGFQISLPLFGLRHSVRDNSTTKSKAVSFIRLLFGYLNVNQLFIFTYFILNRGHALF